MPPKRRQIPQKLKQTTLFNLPMPSAGASSASASKPKAKASRKVSAPMSSPIKSSKTRVLSPQSSSDDLANILLAPTQKASDPDASDNESIPSPTKSTRKRRLITRSPSESESESDNKPIIDLTSDPGVHTDEEDQPTPAKRRRLRRHRSSEGRKDSANEDQDSDEDMEKIAEEVEEERILETRLRARGKKSAFQKNLERYQKRKLKQKESSDEETAGSDEEDDEDEAGSPIKLFKGAKPSNLDDEDEAEEEDDASSTSSGFIVEDGDNEVQLPAQFSMETHQDIAHQFKKIFQFFVYVAVQPPKKRHAFMQNKLEKEEYFSVPLQVTQRKISGMRDSLVASSVWRPEFKRSLEAHPDFEMERLDFAVPHCDACHLGSRMSTYIGRVSGEQYDRIGFQTLPNKKKRRSGDQDEKTQFDLGRFCARRTRVYHSFSHWEYKLFSTIAREIDEVRSSRSSKSGGFHRVAFFAGREPPEDLTDADALCEWLDERKLIDSEWYQLKEMMESARNLEISRKGGEDED